MRGAEAILKKSIFEGKECLIKDRIAKKYRIDELDLALRRRRTKREAKLLTKAFENGILCPKVYKQEKFQLKISYLKGKHPEENKKNVISAAEILSKLHSLDIIHGDFTFANLFLVKGKMHVIDFGLGSFSHKTENKAIDVFTMLLSLHDEELKAIFSESYFSICQNSSKIEDRLNKIKQRVRYS